MNLRGNKKCEGAVKRHGTKNCCLHSLFLHSAQGLCLPSSQPLGVYLIIAAGTSPDVFTDGFAAPHLHRQIGYS